MESRNSGISTLFKKPSRRHSKTYRYLDGKNQYNEINFSCTVRSKPNTASSFLDLEIKTTKFIERCESGNTAVFPDSHLSINFVVLISKSKKEEAVFGLDLTVQEKLISLY